jgi:hypothetical protein
MAATRQNPHGTSQCVQVPSISAAAISQVANRPKGCHEASPPAHRRRPLRLAPAGHDRYPAKRRGGWRHLRRLPLNRLNDRCGDALGNWGAAPPTSQEPARPFLGQARMGRGERRLISPMYSSARSERPGTMTIGSSSRPIGVGVEVVKPDHVVHGRALDDAHLPSFVVPAGVPCAAPRLRPAAGSGGQQAPPAQDQGPPQPHPQ